MGPIRACAQWFRFGMGIFCILACTPLNSSTSPAEGKELTRPGSLDPSKLPPIVQKVRDDSNRWSSVIDGVVPPKVSREVGYQRIVSDVGATQPVNCFVYEQPLDAGQAVSRLLKAISVGIEFDGVQPFGVEAIQGNPVVYLRGIFQSTLRGEGAKRGALQLALSTRLEFPVVCSHEDIDFDPRFMPVVRQFLTNFQVEKPIDNALGKELLVEVWRLGDSPRTLGFSTWRVFESQDGSIANLTISSVFLPYENFIITTDSVALEIQDSRGLREGKWLEVENTEPKLQALLRRDAEIEQTFHVSGQFGSERKEHKFESSTPLRTSYDAFVVFQSSALEGVEVQKQFSQEKYVPQVEPTKPLLFNYDRQSAGNAWKLTFEGTEVEIRLDSAGLPIHMKTEGKEGAATLLHRRINGVPLTRRDGPSQVHRVK